MKIALENIPCPLCGCPDHRLLFQRQDLTHFVTTDYFNVVRCSDCSMVFVNPRPTEKDIHSFYPPDFYDCSIDKETLLEQKKEHLELKWKYVKDLQPGRLLDIGCQKGEFLHLMKQRGWDVSGMDISNLPPNLYGLDIFYGNIKQAPFSESSFDLVTMWAVLEHVYDPQETLQAIHRLLKKKASLVLLVTNIKSIPGRFMRHDDIPRHCLLFSRSTISKILTQTGFKVSNIYFDHRVFGGWHRGFLNYAAKLIAGEKIDEIVRQNRMPGRWNEFSGFLRGKPSAFMNFIDRLDQRCSPYLDKLGDTLGRGFLMIVQAEKTS